MKVYRAGNRWQQVSLASQGARIQFVAAAVLISVIPMLASVCVVRLHADMGGLSGPMMWALGAMVCLTICMGYALLLKYPRTIMRLRNQMEQIARGELPEAIDLVDGESDITAIEDVFTSIVNGMRESMATNKRQGEKLMVAERQRVMSESLCKACHCLGQPATTITCYLELLKAESLSGSGRQFLSNCIAEMEKIRDTLQELQGIHDYEVEAYSDTRADSCLDTKMIKAGHDAASQAELAPEMRELSCDVEPTLAAMHAA